MVLFCPLGHPIGERMYIEGEPLEENIEFERCIEFLVRMIEKYGDVLTDGNLDVEKKMLKSENGNGNV